MFTYFDDKGGSSAFVEIEPDSFPTLSPMYIDFVTFESTTMVGRRFSSYTAAQYLITILLIDPYTALHAYSPMLAIKEFQLPPWTIEQAFTRMTACFRLGPSAGRRAVAAARRSGFMIRPDSPAREARGSSGRPSGIDRARGGRQSPAGMRLNGREWPAARSSSAGR